MIRYHDSHRVSVMLAGIFSCLFLTLNVHSGTYSGGDGSVGDPYQIANTDDLIELSNTQADWDKNFRQTADIAFDADETQVDWDGDGTTWGTDQADDEAGFSPIGGVAAFTGTYRGWDTSGGTATVRTVSNLYINQPATDRLGLFSTIGKEDPGPTEVAATITHIGVVDCDITAWRYAGGIAGQNIFSTVTNCYSTGTITVSGDYTGGLIGYIFDYSADTLVSDCYSTCDVTGNNYIGGLVGYNRKSVISSCYATGNINANSKLGGLIGGITESGQVNLCYATGDVSGNGADNEDIGGLVGYITGGSISSSFATGYISGDLDTGGLVGQNGGTISNCYASGYVNAAEAAGGLVGRNALTITNSFASGAVNGSTDTGSFVGDNQSTVTYCYASGAVTGSTNAGGFAGTNDGTITDCFYDSQTTGMGSTGIGGGTDSGTTASTTTEFKNSDSVWAPSWNIDNSPANFANPWKSNANGRPYLYWQAATVTNGTQGGDNVVDGYPVIGNSKNITATISESGIRYSKTSSISWSTTHSGTAQGAISETLTGLTPDTDYYFQAYATDGTDTWYGDMVKFTTAKKGLTVTGATADNKDYDGNTDATISGATLVGVVGADDVTLSGGGTFAQADAGNDIAVTPSLTLGGTDAGNYSLSQPAGLTADILAVITVNAGTNGLVQLGSGTPAAAVNESVASGGDSSNFTAVPDTGYSFVQWDDANTDNPRQFTAVDFNTKTVEASFTINTYDLTYTAGANGSLQGTTTQNVNYGTDGTAVTAVPDEGYQFEKWSDGSGENPRTDTNVTANVDVSASFIENTVTMYTVTFQVAQSGGGSITGSTTQNIQENGSASEVTAVADSGSTFSGWYLNNLLYSENAALTVENVTSDMTFEARFSGAQVNVTVSTSGEAGHVTCPDGTTVDPGPTVVAIESLTTGKFTAVPDAGNCFSHWVGSANLDIDNENSATCDVTVNGTGTLEAVFIAGEVPDPETGKMKLNINLERSNYADTDKNKIKDSVSLKKAPTGGYDFSGSFDDTGQPTGAVNVRVDGYTFDCSADQGTWKVSGSAEKGFKYTFTSTDKGLKLTLDGAKDEWHFSAKMQKLETNLTGVDWTNGIDLLLLIGGNTAVAVNVDVDVSCNWQYSKKNVAQTTGSLPANVTINIIKLMGQYDSVKESKNKQCLQANLDATINPVTSGASVDYNDNTFTVSAGQDWGSNTDQGKYQFTRDAANGASSKETWFFDTEKARMKIYILKFTGTQAQTIANAIFDNDDDGEMLVTLNLGLASDIVVKLQPTFKIKLSYPQK